MKRIYVSSHIIHSIGYDPESKLLEIEFLSGDIYQYHNVPPILFLEILKTDILSITMHEWMCDLYQCKKLNL